MLGNLTVLARRARLTALAFPVAVLAAGLMLVISESAYHGAESRLTRLVAMGKARIELLRVLQRVTDAESGKRGYILAEGPEYLKPYQSARADVQTGLRQLELLYAEFGDEAAQTQRAHISQLVNAKLSEMEEVLRLFDSGRRNAALEVVRTGIGREQMDQLRREVDVLINDQNARIGIGLTDVYDTLMLNRVGVAAMTTVSLLVLALFLRQGRTLERHRREQQARIQAERDRLEVEVARRTTELTELASHLQTAREDERARLARDLHDELGAVLTAAKLDVARIRPKLLIAAPDLMPRLTHLTESLNSGIALKRRIIEDLRPSTLSMLGLVPALEILCSEFADRAALQVKPALAPVPLTPSAELTVFRLVQESLTNIAKYAQASVVEVTLQRDGEHALVSVTDHGVGFDGLQTPRGSHGLRGMKFRVEAERGRFHVRSAPGQGTTISAWLPLATPATGPTAD